jgi:hypothetical protein
LDVNIIAASIGIVSGALGYWISNFWMQPILRYRSIRNRIHSDFIYYAQVINANGLNGEMQNLYRERILANRKASAELSAAALELPFWYKAWLWLRKRNPAQASVHLIGYSNTPEYEQSHSLQARIRQLLGLPNET